jgi:hypothetical protein
MAKTLVSGDPGVPMSLTIGILLGESYNGICALADLSCVSKIPNKFSGIVVEVRLLYLSSYLVILVSFVFLCFYLYPCYQWRGHPFTTSPPHPNEFTDPSTSTPIYGLNPDVIPWFGITPSLEQLMKNLTIICKSMRICVHPWLSKGMTQETLRWKMYPFSLTKKAKQWYIRSVGSMSGDWEKLRVDFCSSFFLLKCINSLLMDILDFEQLEKESLGAAWARFLRLLASNPHLFITEGVSLYIFCSCLDMKSARELDIIVGGSFEGKTTKEGREILGTLSKTLSYLPTITNPAAMSMYQALRVPQQPNLNLRFPHLNFRLFSPLVNHEHRRKRRFNLWSLLSDSRMILLKTS